MKNKLFELITKYALLLSVAYFVSTAFSWIVVETDYFFEDTVDNMIYKRLAFSALNILLNLIMAFIVAQDIKQHKIETKYVMLATLIYRPLGVLAFLLFVFLHEQSHGEGAATNSQ